MGRPSPLRCSPSSKSQTHSCTATQRPEVPSIQGPGCPRPAWGTAAAHLPTACGIVAAGGRQTLPEKLGQTQPSQRPARALWAEAATGTTHSCPDTHLGSPACQQPVTPAGRSPPSTTIPRGWAILTAQSWATSSPSPDLYLVAWMPLPSLCPDQCQQNQESPLHTLQAETQPGPAG